MSPREAPPPRPAYRREANDNAVAWSPAAEPAARGRLADTLEPGPLRDELGGATPVPSSVEPARIATFRFTGSGAEYFRIWVVNLLLTLVTCGIYSAWAKVRKTRYFWQNTRLGGHAFDYHGDPVAILLGRVIALVLLAGYTIAFDISRTAGLTMILLLCAAGPWLFMRAQRFKLVNSSWRGLRFGFDASVRDAYRIGLPPLLIWFSSTVVAGLASDRIGLLVAAGLASGVLFPWMHHRLKAWQHDRARYGERRFAFLPATGRFYAVYLAAGLLAFVGVIVGMSVSGIITTAASVFGEDAPAFVPFMISASFALFVYLVAWPYFAARLQAAVWSHTRLGDVKFATAIAAWPLLWLTARNIGLTLLTAGLYWPFAAVALARYRVECMRAESEQPLGALAEATGAAPGLAAGDAALDAFGLDIGL